MSPEANQSAKPNANPNPESGDAESLDKLAGEAADFFASYLMDYAAICTSSMASIQAGTYKVETAWADGIKLWSSYVSGMGKALDLSSRTAKAAAKNPPQAGPPPAKTPEGDHG